MIILGLCVFVGVFMIMALCKVASDADDEMEAVDTCRCDQSNQGRACQECIENGGLK